MENKLKRWKLVFNNGDTVIVTGNELYLETNHVLTLNIFEEDETRKVKHWIRYPVYNLRSWSPYEE